MQRHGGLLIALLALCALGPAPAEDAAPPPETKPPAKETPRPWLPKDPPPHDTVSGSFSTRLDVETAGGESDWRTDQYLRLNIQPESTPKLSLHGALWMWEDLDGKEPADSPLRGLNDTYGGAVQARPLYLYAEGKDLWGDSTLRVGRQRIDESTGYSLVDGVYFSKRIDHWSLYAFAGTRGTLYGDSFQDPSVGAGAAFRPTAYTKLAIDTYYSTESRDAVDRPWYADLFGLSYPLAVPSDAFTRQVAFTATQRIGENHQLYARYMLNDGDADEFRLAATGSFTKQHIAYNVAYSQRFNEVTDRSNDSTGYYRVLGPLSEYRDLSANLSVPFATHYALTLEGQRHDSSGHNDYNRDYTRYGLFLSGGKLWNKSLDFRVGVSRWDVDGGTGTWSVTGDVTKRINKTALSLGADYAVYQDRYETYKPGPYNFARLVTAALPGSYPGFYPIVRFTDTGTITTDNNVYSLFGKIAYTLNDRESLWFKLTYQLDDGPDAPYWRAQAEYSIRF